MQVSKRYMGYVFGTLVLFATFIMFLCLPQSVFAAVLPGDVVPEITCTYTDPTTGQQVDGNHLVGGETYNVSFVITDLNEMSVVQVSATYDEDVTVGATPVALLSDSINDVSSMGYVFGFVSDNATCSVIGSPAVLATIEMTINVEDDDVDAEGYLTISSNPNLTFALTDYTYGYADEYAIDTTFQGYDGTLYPMTYDVTPTLGVDVSGELRIATDLTATVGDVIPYGTFTISVYADTQHNDLIQTVESTYAATGNTFTIPQLSAGTYYATVTSDYMITLSNVTITVGETAIENAVIYTLPLDLDQNGTINPDDANVIFKAFLSSSSEIKPYCDLDGNGTANPDDANVIYKMFLKGQALSAQTIA